jgi:hypothetical protein
MTAQRATPFDDYPVRLNIAYPSGGSRWMILVRWFLALPHFFLLAVTGIPIAAMSAVPWIALAAIVLAAFHRPWTGAFSVPAVVPGWALVLLITATFPVWLFRYIVWVQRYALNVQAYVLFHNQYPPVGGDENAYPMVTLEVPQQARYSRWLPFVKWLLVIPHYFVLSFLGMGMTVSYMGTWFAVLATGRYPHNLFEFQAGYLQWNARVQAYVQLLTDEYPPFSFGRKVSQSVVLWSMAIAAAIGILMLIAFAALIVLLIQEVMHRRELGTLAFAYLKLSFA